MTDQKPPALELNGSRLFTAWLKNAGVSLAFTTYQAGKVFFIGLQPDGRLSVFERTFERPMGLGTGQGRFWMSSVYQLWRFENFLDPGQMQDGYDAYYVPVSGHTTGDIDIHDIHEDAEGNPIFVATRFNCLATLSDRGSFREVWRPPFIDQLAAEDRCHLNGMAMQYGRPAYVTCLSRTNVFEGWRDKRRDGGVVLDVASGEMVAEGLSMPHSPRLHRGELWLLNSGTGELGIVDDATSGKGKFVPRVFCPGFARGLAFAGDYAFVGLSKPRYRRFEGLALDQRLVDADSEPWCGIQIIDLTKGVCVEWFRIDGAVKELFDVAVLKSHACPMSIGPNAPEIVKFMTH